MPVRRPSRQGCLRSQGRRWLTPSRVPGAKRELSAGQPAGTSCDPREVLCGMSTRQGPPEARRAVVLPLVKSASGDAWRIVYPLSHELRQTLPRKRTEVAPAPLPAGRGDEPAATDEDPAGP